jgi:AraC-like DNA-binding protein
MDMQLNGICVNLSRAAANDAALGWSERPGKGLRRGAGVQGLWSERVAAILLEAEDFQPTLTLAADRLHVTARTLERYLEREGCSFRDLSLRIRNQRACSLLVEGRLTISQIAYALGYTDIANFSRWFKKMSGVPPSAYKGEPSRTVASRQALQQTQQHTQRA